MRRARPKQHVRKLKRGRRIIVNRGVKKKYFKKNPKIRAAVYAKTVPVLTGVRVSQTEGERIKQEKDVNRLFYDIDPELAKINSKRLHTPARLEDFKVKTKPITELVEKSSRPMTVFKELENGQQVPMSEKELEILNRTKGPSLRESSKKRLKLKDLMRRYKLD